MMIDSIESNKGEFNNSFFLFLGVKRDSDSNSNNNNS